MSVVVLAFTTLKTARTTLSRSGRRIDRPDILMIVVRDAGSVLVHADDRCIDHLYRSVMPGSKRIHDLAPDTSLPPANEAIVTSSAGTIGCWQSTPRPTRTDDPKV